MPLTLQALSDCATFSLLNSRTSATISSKGRRQSQIRSTSPWTLSRLVVNRSPLTSISSARFQLNGSIVGGPNGSKTYQVPNKSNNYGVAREEKRQLVGSVESLEENGDSMRMGLSKMAVLTGLVALQVCMPAFAQSLGLEVARSSDSTGLMTDVSDFQSGFSSAFLLIFFSEIGDKTFFIAALLATRKSNIAVFTGTFGALAAMTVISVVLGRAFHLLDNLIPTLGTTQLPLDDLAAVVLLVYFGISTLLDAASMEGSKSEDEKQDAELAIAGVSEDGSLGLQAAASTIAATFVLVFVAEWGDKSFFATIALAAASSPAGVVTGAIAGHGVATALAVLGGSFLSEYVSEKLIAYTGGVLFLVFAATTLVDILK